MSKVHNFADVLTKIYKNNIRSEKYDFLDKLEITRTERAIIKSAKSITNKLNLAKYMTRWRLFTSDKRNNDNIEKLKKVSNGGDILANLKYSR